MSVEQQVKKLVDRDLKQELEAGMKYHQQLYSHYMDSSNIYLELELIRGCTLLSQIADNNKAIASNVKFYAAEVIIALQHLHS